MEINAKLARAHHQDSSYLLFILLVGLISLACVPNGTEAADALQKRSSGQDIIMAKGKLIMRGGKGEGNIILDTSGPSHSSEDSHHQMMHPMMFNPHLFYPQQHHQQQHQPMMMHAAPIILEDHSAMHQQEQQQQHDHQEPMHNYHPIVMQGHHHEHHEKPHYEHHEHHEPMQHHQHEEINHDDHHHQQQHHHEPQQHEEHGMHHFQPEEVGHMYEHHMPEHHMPEHHMPEHHIPEHHMPEHHGHYEHGMANNQNNIYANVEPNHSVMSTMMLNQPGNVNQQHMMQMQQATSGELAGAGSSQQAVGDANKHQPQQQGSSQSTSQASEATEKPQKPSRPGQAVKKTLVSLIKPLFKRNPLTKQKEQHQTPNLSPGVSSAN